MKIHQVTSQTRVKGQLDRVQVAFLYDVQIGAQYKTVARRSGTLHLRRTLEWNVKEDKSEVLYKGNDPFRETGRVVFSEREVMAAITATVMAKQPKVVEIVPKEQQGRAA